MSSPQTIAAVNALPEMERQRFYGDLIPEQLLGQFNIDPKTFKDSNGQRLFIIKPGLRQVELMLFHQYNFPDPILYFHLADTLNYKIIIMIAVINNPESPRFDVDMLPGGQKTNFGMFKRNLEAEQAAMEYGLAPGQIRSGLRLMRGLAERFESFAQMLGDDIYYVEPLHYHNAINFERMGFSYQRGRKLMEELHTRFSPGGDLVEKLDGSTPFRKPEFANSIRGRSWAIHDGLLGEPFTGVQMYKRLGQQADVCTYPNSVW